MVKYEHSTIYKLCCKNPEIKDEYIGSTTNFSRRKCQHKSACNTETGTSYNMTVYKCIRDNGGFDNWDMIEIEKYSATDKKDLHKRERYWIETLKPSLNQCVPTRTKNEFYEENKEFVLAHQKIYYERNKEIIAERGKEYREKNKEHLAEKKREYYERNKERLKENFKEYREKNKETIAEMKKKWGEKNKEHLLEKRKEKIVCKCGQEITKTNILRHEKSQKHKQLLGIE